MAANDIRVSRISNGFLVKVGWNDDMAWTFRKWDEVMLFLKEHGKRIMDCETCSDINEVLQI